MTKQEIAEAVKLLKELHLDATRYLHDRGDIEPTGIIARIAYLMGEMKAPIRALADACPPDAPDGA